MTTAINNILFITFVKKQLISQQIRFYPRWSHRKPLKILTPEECKTMAIKYEIANKPKKEKQVETEDLTVLDKYARTICPKINWRSKNSLSVLTNKEDTDSSLVKYKIKSKKEGKPLVGGRQNKIITTTDMLETVIDEKGNFIYTKMGNNDHRVGTMLTEVKSRNEKGKKDFILLEGKRLIKDALQSGCQLKYILFSRKNEIEYLKPFLPKLGARLYKMPYKEMQMWSDLATNPGIMGIFKIPVVVDFKPKKSIPFTVICDNIREPGNLGTALRICAAVGCERVILTKGCVNVWDSKVLRSSVGAHFKLNIQKNLDWDVIEKEIGQNVHVFIADNKIVSDNRENSEDLETILKKIPILPYYGVDFKAHKHTVLIVGGETLGVSKNCYEVASKMNGARLNIPLCNDIDSLNVGAALGIIAFEFKKQLLQKNM